MVIQIIATAFLIMLVQTMIFHFHKEMGHNPPDWVKIIEIVVWLGSIVVMFGGAFFWVWFK